MAKIVFVDKDDNVIGAGTKAEAFEKGICIRIIRIFLFNSKGEILMQKRSEYVAVPGKWDQSVGGHVDEGEEYIEAATREMHEEMGTQGVQLTPVAKYLTETSHLGLARRFNMLYTGICDGEVRFNEREVAEVRWFTKQGLMETMRDNPDIFTIGAIQAFKMLQERNIV